MRNLDESCRWENVDVQIEFVNEPGEQGHAAAAVAAGLVRKTMKSTAIITGIIAAGILLVGALRGNRKSTVMDEKIHDLQEHFKRLDAEAPVV
jgi:hypothetical protein